MSENNVLVERVESDGKAAALSEALVEVRRAYRLAWAFQRRLFDLLNTFASELEGEGLSLTRWDPGHASRPPQSSSRFYSPEYWAWDFLGAYQIRLLFDSAPNRPGGAAHVWCKVKVDTGYSKRDDHSEPDANTFEPVEESKSLLGLFLGRSSGGPVDWKQCQITARATPGFAHGKLHTLQKGELTVSLLGWDVDLAKLHDRDSANRHLVEPVIRFLRESQSEVPGQSVTSGPPMTGG